MTDSAEREQALDLGRSFCVRAPAGSGKTGLLICRMLRALSVVEQPEQVLAITFTRKAAAEIRARLSDALAAAQGPAPADAWQAGVHQLASAALRQSEARGWELLHNPNRLRASTIDSLNRELARQMPVLSGLGASIQPLDDASELYREALLRALDRHEQTDCPAELREAISACYRFGSNRLERLLDDMAPMLGQRDQWAILSAGNEALEDKAHACLEVWISDTLQAADRHLPTAPRAQWLQALRTLAQDGAADWAELADLQQWPAAEAQQLYLWQALARSLLTQSGGWRSTKGLKSNTGFAKSAATTTAKELLPEFTAVGEGAALLALQQLQKLPKQIDPAEQQLARQLLTVLHAAFAELRLVFAERGCCDHLELALAARQGLLDDEAGIAAEADERLRHILVDEMQDTSAGQIQLLECLVQDWQNGDGRSLFLVGDPQQSIYAFRQARVELFNQLLRPGAHLGPVPLQGLQLQRNFRSRPELVDWCNRHIGEAFAARHSPISFAPSSAARPGGTGSAVLLHTATDAEHEAELALAALREIRARDPGVRVGVLARGRAQLRPLALRLREAGMAFSGIELQALQDTPAVRNYLALLRVLHSPLDDLAWLRVLRCSAVGLSWAACDALAAGQPEASWRERILTEGTAQLDADSRSRLAHLRREFQLAQADLQASGQLPQVLRALHHRLGLQAGLNAIEQQDIHKLQQHLAAHCPQGLLLQENAFNRSLHKLYADTPAARIELMTVHKSKGLEFDQLLVMGMGRSSRGGQMRPLRLASNRAGPCLALRLPEQQPGDLSLASWVAALDNRAEADERLRLLYVALTRAREGLQLFCTAKPPRDSLGGLFSDELEWPAVTAPESGPHKSADEPALEAVRHPYHALADLGAPACVAVLGAGGSSGASPSTLETQAPGSFSSHSLDRAVASLIGTSVHEALEYFAQHGCEVWHNRRNALLDSLQAGLARRGLDPQQQGIAMPRITELLDTAMQGQAPHLLAPRPWARSEYAVAGEIEGQLVQGIIDRCFITSDGTLWVVDYKTNDPAGELPLETWLGKVAEQYRPQLQQYSALLQKLRKPTAPIRAALYLLAVDLLLEIGPQSYNIIQAPEPET